MLAVWLVPGALLLDLLVGDPAWCPHPVRGMGWMIIWLEGWLRRFAQSQRALRWAGLCLVVLMVGGAYLLVYWFIRATAMLSPLVGMVFSLWLISTTIALRGLRTAALEVYHSLCGAGPDLGEARERLGRIVGRDTGNLDEEGIVRATVETVAENTVDAIISPLFYAFLGGAPLAMAYRAVNTLDSMVGYRNERYLHFGWAAARLDDVANWLPARLAGWLLVGTCFLGGMDWRRVWTSIRHYAGRHLSPNSGIMEAGVAGALGVQLGGTAYYSGIPSYRAYLGMAIKPPAPGDIIISIRLMYGVTALGTVLTILLLFGWAAVC